MSGSDGAPDRPRLLRKFKRVLADHGVRINPLDLACLQPASGTSPRRADVALLWHPYQIKTEAIDRSGLCDSVAEGDAKDACRDEKYGQAVMWAVPEIGGQCRTANAPNFDPDAIAECAKNRFLNAWTSNEGIVPAPIPANWVTPAWCDPKIPQEQRRNALRDALLKALQPQADQASNEELRAGPSTGAPADNPPIAIVPAPPAPPAADEDEAYCNYMAREIVRGELTPSPATAIPPGCRATINAALALKAQQQSKPFTMDPDETDREVARLMGQPQAGGKSSAK